MTNGGHSDNTTRRVLLNATCAIHIEPTKCVRSLIPFLMRQPLLSIIVFALCFGLGILASMNTVSVPTERRKRIETVLLSAASNSSDFVANPEKHSSEKDGDPPQVQKTLCTDPKILPIWKLIRRDADVREALENVWSPFDSPDCKDMVELKYMDLDRDGRAELLVRGGGTGLCGAVGNCDFWVIRRERNGLRLLLHADDYIDELIWESRSSKFARTAMRTYSLKATFLLLKQAIQPTNTMGEDTLKGNAAITFPIPMVHNTATKTRPGIS